MRRAMLWGMVTAGALVLLTLAGLGLNTLRGVTGHTVPRVAPEALSELLAPSYRIMLPPGDGPHPALLLFSGCDGPKDNMDLWARMAHDMGWATVIVDSHGPRGFGGWQIWRLICVGQLLTGPERAGDVAVALADARAHPQIDAGRLVLLGASHGGWAVLDLLALHSRGRVPHNLTRWPDSIARDGLAGLRGAILLYPYCGPLAQAARRGWAPAAPLHFLLARDDAIVNETHCTRLAERLRGAGHVAEVTLYDGVTHGFDQTDRAPLSLLEFSPDATQAALARGRALLAQFARGDP